MNFWKLFRVFLWKNALFVRFNWLSLVLNFLGCFLCILIYLKSTYAVLSVHSVTYESKNLELLKEQYFPANAEDLLFFCPETEFTNILMENVRLELQMTTERIIGGQDPIEMRLQMERQCTGSCFGVYFTDTPSINNDGSLAFSISSTAMRASPRKRYVNDEEVAGVKDDDDYIRTGFFTLQSIIDRQYLKLKGSTFNNYNLEISSIPTIEQEYMDSLRVVYFGTVFSILFNVLVLSTFLVPLVEEKQNGLKEFLVVATPLNFLNGITFFVVRFALYVVFFTGVLVAAFVYKSLGVIPIIYIFILFMLYMVSTMAYGYLISVCFNTVFYAKVGGLIMLVLPHIFHWVEGSFSTFAMFIFNTKTFLSALDVFQKFTNKHRKFYANDFYENITENSFTISTLLTIMFFQCLLYAILYNYLSHIFPGPGGLKQPYLFFLKASFYKKRHRNQYTTTERGTDAIIIQDLVKKFKTPTCDICISDRLNMVIKNKQITVLLGHNGAGKTTTLNMIMGSIPKDSGKIIVCSERDVSSYRHLIGFCPQHSVFMHYMTCTQHLQFFAQLRGMSARDALSFSDNLLKQLRLKDKEFEFGKNLSGGMKRRLSLGIAIAGDTKVIILDEPSSGLDIESRRELWDILLELRKTKAILVTTHHMEEAEVLGDTICILANGRLQRVGSPLELKRKVGTGYILKLCADTENHKPNETMQLLQNYVPNAKLLTTVPPTALYSLPYNYKSAFSPMLLKLEKLQNELGIQSISITDTSLEDVFLHCADEVDEIDSPVTSCATNSRIPYQQLNTPKQVAWHQQFNAIFYKRLIYIQNEWFYTIFMILLPFLALTLTIMMINNMSVGGNNDVLQLDMNIYKNGVVYLHNSNDTNGLVQVLEEQFLKYNVKLEYLNLPEGKSLSDELIDLQRKDLASFLQNAIGVIDINAKATSFNLYYSGNIYHSSVTILNMLDDAILKLSTKVQSSIQTSYAPIRRFVNDVSPTRLENYAVIVPIGMFFFMFYFIKLPYVENESGFKDLQTVPRHVYWLANLSFDLMLHLGVCLFLFFYQKIFMSSELYNSREQFLIMSSIFFYGLSYLPILYCFANNFRSISTISTYLLLMLIISAIMPHITSNNVQSMDQHETTIRILSIFPDFNLNHQLRIINEQFLLMRQNKHSNRVAGGGTGIAKDGTKNLYKDVNNVLDRGTFFSYAILVFVAVFLFFVYILENKYKKQFLSNIFVRKSPIHVENQNERDAVEEKALVNGILDGKNENNYPLLVNGLYKCYTRKVCVVKDLNFAVRKKECFGLLGVNGAGKTSTFQMISANIPITMGTIKIDGYDILQSETKYKYRFGYCPQNDALNKFMTSYQTLRYIGELRGLGGQNLEKEISYWLEELKLEKYRNIEIHHYSGGTKRKLNAAIAMIGGPSLVLLDEPTTGVDPISRRLLWKCIQDFQKRDKTIVLTSHSMDECEQLCNRLAIMTDGKFKCIGFIPNLKKRFGCGFTINVKMKDPVTEPNVNQVKCAIHSQFPDSDLRENHAGMLTFFIREIKSIVWSSVFKRAEQFAFDCSNLIEDYSINEIKLEDIFLKFSNRKPSSIASTSVHDVV